jgi:hypothetical protein
MDRGGENGGAQGGTTRRTSRALHSLSRPRSRKRERKVSEEGPLSFASSHIRSLLSPPGKTTRRSREVHSTFPSTYLLSRSYHFLARQPPLSHLLDLSHHDKTNGMAEGKRKKGRACDRCRVRLLLPSPPRI